MSLMLFAPDPNALERATITRVHSHLLGDCGTFLEDRRVADRVAKVYPLAERIAHDLRATHMRIVEWLVQAGITQLIDVGGGLLRGSTHYLARKINRGVSVVYVERDPVAQVQLLRQVDGLHATAVVAADVLDPDQMWKAIEGCRLIDWRNSFALLMSGVLHTVRPGADDPDDRAVYRAVADYAGRLHSRAMLAITHLTTAASTGAHARRATAARSALVSGDLDIYPRDQRQLPRLLDGLMTVQPWTTTPGAPYVWTGIGRGYSTGVTRRELRECATVA